MSNCPESRGGDISGGSINARYSCRWVPAFVGTKTVVPSQIMVPIANPDANQANFDLMFIPAPSPSLS
jgi:hypothetical protein